jgi:bifunctional non-homologous end joining protein LigD
MKLLQSSSRPKSRKAASRAHARAPRHAAEMPLLVPPMLAVLSQNLPAKAVDYAFEYKWDGVRAICRWDGNAFSLQSRNQLDITNRYPELWPLGEVFGSRAVMLDGEVITLDEHERPSFSRLQRRMHVRDMTAVRRLMGDVPVFYVVFDVLWLDGKSLIELPWVQRRDRLEELELSGPAWLRSPAHIGEGEGVLAAARQIELEGVVAKRLDSPYRPGARAPDWLKIKIVADDEFVIGGWVPEAGTRTGRVGSLLLGYYDAQKKLHFAGGVGTGFNDEDHKRLAPMLQSLAQSSSPFVDRVPKAGALFVKPKLVAQVEYRRKGPEGILQQAAFKGLRTDKSAEEIEIA